MAKSGTPGNIIGFNEDVIIEIINNYMFKHDICTDRPILLTREEFINHTLRILEELDHSYITIEQGLLGA